MFSKVTTSTYMKHHETCMAKLCRACHITHNTPMHVPYGRHEWHMYAGHTEHVCFVFHGSLSDNFQTQQRKCTANGHKIRRPKIKSIQPHLKRKYNNSLNLNLKKNSSFSLFPSECNVAKAPKQHKNSRHQYRSGII